MRRVGAAALIAALAAAAFAPATHAGAEILQAKRAAITGRIVLDRSRVAAGGTLRGRVVFENRTARRKVLLRTCAINGLYAIGLRFADGYIQAPAFSLVGCNHGLMAARPGKTVYRFELQATYRQCTESVRDQQPKGSPSWTPLCLKDSSGRRDRVPPLPAGTYTAIFFPDGRWRGPRVAPAKLVVSGSR